MIQKTVLDVEGKKLHLVSGKTYADWRTEYRNDADLWSFPLYELIDGTVEINEDIWYWLIKDRCYETYEEA